MILIEIGDFAVAPHAWLLNYASSFQFYSPRSLILEETNVTTTDVNTCYVTNCYALSTQR